MDAEGNIDDTGTQGKFVNWTGDSNYPVPPSFTIYWVSRVEKTLGPDLTESTYFSYKSYDAEGNEIAIAKFHTITELEVFSAEGEYYTTNGWVGVPGRVYVDASGNADLSTKYSCISM